MNLKNSKILITGGTGSLGRALAGHLKCKKITIYSRGEHKQMEMQKKFPDCNYILGDVRDLERLKMAMKNQDIVIHAAALKVVPKGEIDPMEFIKTNIIGGMNVVLAALAQEVNTVLAVSTDKACDPINLYGANKLVADKLFQSANIYSVSGVPRFLCVRYGNVIGSTGSVIPHFMALAGQALPLTITNPAMTRFIITLKQACEFIEYALEKGEPGEILVPKLKAMNIMDMAKAVWKRVNGTCVKGVYKIPFKKKIIGIRPGEKRHEKLEGTNGCYYSNQVEQLTKEEFLCYLSEM